LYSKVDPSNEEQPTWQEEFANTSTDEVNF
jgi:hypothetical protein